MKRILALVSLLIIAIGSIYLAQRHHRHDVVSSNAVLDAGAEWQRDLSRAPLHYTRISDDQEIAIGNELARQYLSVRPPLDARGIATEQYVATVGARVAVNVHRRIPYHFHYLADRDLINAFALPGGQIFIGEGLLNRMTSEDELAFVLGHEIEHVDHYHPAERIQMEAQLKRFNLDVVAELASIPVSLWQAGYSKDQEFEADREGERLAYAAGYSPQGAIDMMECFVHLESGYSERAGTPLHELSHVAIEGLVGYFRTHPISSERLAQARQIVQEDLMDTHRSKRPFRVEYEVTAP